MSKEKKLFIASIPIFAAIGILTAAMGYVGGIACLFFAVTNTVIALLVELIVLYFIYDTNEETFYYDRNTKETHWK